MASSLVSSLRIASRTAPLITSRSAIRPAASFFNQQRNTFATTAAKMAVQGTSSGQPIATLDVRYPRFPILHTKLMYPVTAIRLP